jgi:hypothetical protein
LPIWKSFEKNPEKSNLPVTIASVAGSNLCERKGNACSTKTRKEIAVKGNENDAKGTAFAEYRVLSVAMPWLCFLLSAAVLSVFAYLTPVIIRTVMEFYKPVFFGWVAIHIFIAMVVGTLGGFWVKHRVDESMRARMHELMQGKKNVFDGEELDFVRALFLRSLSFALILTMVLSILGVLIASILHWCFHLIDGFGFLYTVLSCVASLSILVAMLLCSRHKRKHGMQPYGRQLPRESSW